MLHKVTHLYNARDMYSTLSITYSVSRKGRYSDYDGKDYTELLVDVVEVTFERRASDSSHGYSSVNEIGYRAYKADCQDAVYSITDVYVVEMIDIDAEEMLRSQCLHIVVPLDEWMNWRKATTPSTVYYDDEVDDIEYDTTTHRILSYHIVKDEATWNITLE